MINASTNLDDALLADGVLWQAANAVFEAACDDHDEDAIDKTPTGLREIRDRILSTPAKTPAGQAVKLAIFKSIEASSSVADATKARADQLAHLIAGDDVETAAAYSLMLDFIASASASPLAA